MPVDLARELLVRVLEAIGVKGVSVMGLLILLLAVMYAHRARRYGSRVANAGSTATHDMTVVALALAALAVAGVVSLNLDRGTDLLDVAVRHLQSVLGDFW